MSFDDNYFQKYFIKIIIFNYIIKINVFNFNFNKNFNIVF
jgi:hypothetical protein